MAPRAPKPPPTQAGLLSRRCAAALAAHRRRAAAEGQTLDYGQAGLEALAAASPLCHYCHMPFGWADLAFDHRTPTARGGAHAMANLAVCCRPCNELKGSLDYREWLALAALLATLSPASAEDVRRRLRAGSAVYRRGRR